MDNIQNMQPNCPQLAQLIRQNLTYHHQQSLTKTLFKESMVKISLDKDFEDIFNHPIEHVASPPPVLLEAPEELKNICCWLEDSDTYGSIAYLPTDMMPRLIHILHQKVDSLAIIITEYQSWWMAHMEQMCRLSTLKWGFLNSQLTNDEKVKVLELYQLKKLKLLFIAPSLFKVEDYYQLECDLLVVCDLHLYAKDEPFLNTLAAKTSPGRLLALHTTLTNQQYNSLNLPSINSPNHLKYNYIVLKTNNKPKTIVSYISKNNLKNVLIIINRKHQLPQLINKLQLQSLGIFNILDALTIPQISSYTSHEIFNHSDKNQQHVMDVVRKASQHNITLSTYFDMLRLGNFDAVIFYSFVEVKKFVDWCPQVANKLMLLMEDDVCTVRNNITSDYMMSNHLQTILTKLMEKVRKKQQGNNKRFYSQDINDRMMECFSVTKDNQPNLQEKVIKVNMFCRNYDLTPKMLKRIIDLLSSQGIIEVIHRIPCEIEVDQTSLVVLKKLHPKVREVRKKVDLLHLSSSLQRTTLSILIELKARDIKYKITEEAIQFRLLKDYQEIQWMAVVQQLNKKVEDSANTIDRSYQMFKQCAYGSMELARREKVLCRKNKLIHFISNIKDISRPNILDSSHRSNLLTAEIEQWIRNSQERLDEHDLILMLQGVQKTKMNHFKKDPIFGRYKRYKYEEIQQAVQRITKNKRIKL